MLDTITHPPLFIFSSHRTPDDVAAFVRQAGYSNIRELLGSWQGTVEPSYAVASWTDPEAVYEALRPLIVRQSSVLYLHSPSTMAGERAAQLHWLENGRHIMTTPAGTWRQVSRDYARSQPGWTYDPQSNTHWLAE